MIDKTISFNGLNEAMRSYGRFDLFDSAIVLAWRGSIAHGTYVKNHIDDKDIAGVVIPPIGNYLGLDGFGDKTKTIAHNKWDIVFYELRKYVKLLLKSNPNILSLLWLEDDFYIKVTDEWRELVDNRDKFMSKEIYKTFSGYAYAQLNKIDNVNDNKNKGAKSKQSIERFGYNTKNASHLIMILKMGIEALETGQINVYREKDRGQLIQIKNGEWKLGKVKKLADNLFRKLNYAMEHTKLTDSPDHGFAERFLISTLKSHFKLKK